MNIPYDDLDFGPAELTYTFKPGQVLPKVGEVMHDERCSMVVIESNDKNNYIKVLLTSTETVATRMERYKEEVESSMEEVAEMLFKKTSDGMTSLIGWDNLPEDTKSIYRDLAEETVLLLDNKGLLILKYKEDD